MEIVGSAVHVAVILSAIVHCRYFMRCLFVTLLISSCHHSYYQRILPACASVQNMADAIASVRVRERAVCICK